MNCRNCNAPIKSSDTVCSYCNTPYLLKDVSHNKKENKDVSHHKKENKNENYEKLNFVKNEKKISKKWGIKQTIAEFAAYCFLLLIFESQYEIRDFISTCYGILIYTRFFNFIGITKIFSRKFERFITNKTTFFKKDSKGL